MNEPEMEQTDDWGDERKSFETMTTEETKQILYGEAANTDEPEAPKVVAAPEPTPEADDSDKYSPEEWAQFAKFGQQVQQLRADEQRYAEAAAKIQQAGGDIVKACGGDRDQAAAVRVELLELAQSIEARREDEARKREAFTQHQTKRAQSKEFKAMTAKEPALADADNRKALGQWLIERGFDPGDVSAISGKQAVAAWKVMKEAQGSRKLKVPANARKKVTKRAPKEEPDLPPESPGSKFAREFYGAERKAPYSLTDEMAKRRKSTDPISILYGPG